MLSLQQAIEIKESIKSYLQATFTFRKREVAHAFEAFIEHPTLGMFKGPYVSLKLPFVKAEQETIDQIPLTIKPDWTPYDHQVKSWIRLSTQGKEPEPTIITTGTGSGKTEAFLYPVLDYCFRQQHRPGIKVIIMYPMNALATDQAKRLAEIIYKDERLRGRVRAGLFIGEGNGPKGQYPKVMEEDHIVEHRDTILDAPPDILLTNFKMLDYALMKHNFQRLWNHNVVDPSLLRFLVLDELHTYDGAQGTDVANLIRRLKLKLTIEPGQLCPIGTSATIGSGADAPQLLSDYATKVFGETVGTDALITETRITPDRFFESDEVLNDFIPLPNRLKDLVYHERDNFEAYLKAHIDIWQQDEVHLADGLLKLKIVKDLVVVINRGNGIKQVEEITRELGLINEPFRKLAQWDEVNRYSPKTRVLESLLALIAAAKDVESDRSPFMYLQVQLWVRELSGVQYTLEYPAKFSFRDQVDAQQEVAAMPPWYCRECNSSGWLGVKPDDKDVFSRDVNEVYEKFFSNNKNLYFILPGGELSPADFEATGYNPETFLEYNIDPKTLKAVGDKEEGFAIQALRKLKENRADHTCPCCNSANTVAIIGTKIPTLSSIAVSQTLATDLDITTDRDRKVLAFTNSVQDAAHQAGFIESRNYRFTFRASLQKVINELNHPVRLNELADSFISFWKQHGDETEQDHQSGYLYRFFPKEYVGKASPKDYLIDSGVKKQYAEHFLKELDQRVRWEIYSEFGFTSRVGRTLEKTGASSAYFDTSLLHAAWDEMMEWIEHNDVSRSIKREDFLKFTNLVLHRIRTRGAIDHAYYSKYRSERLSLWDLNWQKDGCHFLNPTYHPNSSRFPKLLTNQGSRDNLLDTTTARKSNWFHAYFNKTFLQAAVTLEFINEFYEQWTAALTTVGILNRETAGDHTNYAINADAIWVAKYVNEFACTQCEDVLYSHDDLEMADDACCLSHRCTGHYKATPQTVKNYYNAVYNRNRFPRIYSSEHTGLLERQVRERLEMSFKKRNRFDSPNTLIATSTLEMGIDIGSLNTAYNNSVPPLPSNFLQRVGRAGRSSGAALVVNFVKNQNHDLYYYADPMEMMRGDVNTPGCYLEAKDILRRHFTAYCIDSWVAVNPTENSIPTFMRDLKLGSRNLTDTAFFINRLNNFIKENRYRLVPYFLKQYPTKIKNQVFPEINDSLTSGAFYDHLLSVFMKVKEELLEIDKRREELKEEVKILNLAKGDPLFDEYIREGKNLGGVKKSIFARNVLEHMTNVGILPNYAFPETGVQLHAHVISSVIAGTTNRTLDKSFEVVRPASQAIKELAPENYFYTQGYRFEISGVNTFDWSDQALFHNKRFCSKCDHLEIDSLSSKGNCPKCGDPSWASSSNVHRFAKLITVKSFNSEARSRLKDDKDDRDVQQYQLMHHVIFDRNSSEGAWVLKEIPFGIEFVKNATITSVNYGRLDGNDARKIKINDTEALTKGFVTCRLCGKSTSSTHLIHEAKDYHYGYCKHRNTKYKPGETNDVFEEVYFFREMHTEILKIILPVQEFNTEADIRMFQAGLELGLKRYFKGNPGHIRVLSYREFNRQTDKFDRFLLFYDTIPGGTGYLKQLFAHEEFSLLLRESYEAIRDCTCQLDGHDGCYKCIYSYGNQYNRDDLSRRKAEEWFERIYRNSEQWIKNDHGLGSLTNSGKIEESELEERFIKLLQIFAENNEGYDFQSRKDDDSVYYELKINKGDTTARYWIRPQISLGPKDGIAYSTRVDFLVVCAEYTYKGISYVDEVSKIALYLDGYQFHASKEHNVFEKDVRIRQAIAAQPEYRTWTLTWNDLNNLQAILEKTGNGFDELYQNYLTRFSHNYLGKLIPTVRHGEIVNYALPKNNFLRFWEQLLNPPIGLFEKSWFTYLGSWTEKLLEPSFNPDSLKLLLSKEMIYDSFIKNNRVTDFNALLPVEHGASFDFAEWNIWVNIGNKRIYSNLQLKESMNMDKQEWEYFWHLFNLYQTSEFVDQMIDVGEGMTEQTDENLLEELKQLYAPNFHPILKQGVKNKVINRENMDFLDSWVDDDGNILADAELVLETLRIAICPYSDESLKVFQEAGFTIYNKEQLNEIIL